ncbi:hypothetical protein J6590_045609 [Homalodisca vitripennis]|nr:hypothetical protein J6590_045609 [Homalodisca vitripennis]
MNKLNDLSKSNSELTLERDSLQNSAARFVFCIKRFHHVSSHRDAANILCMEQVCRIIMVCVIHKALRFVEPLYLCEKFVQRQEVSQHSCRQDNQFHFPRVRLEVVRRSFSYFGPKLYNDLPGSLKSTQSLSSFRSKLKDLMLTSCK